MTDKIFLKILKAALCGEQAVIDTPLSLEDRMQVFRLAEIHRVLPLIFDSAYTAFPYDKGELDNIKSCSKLLVLQQAVKTQSFLNLYRSLSESSMTPVIVKGIVCRSLYPKPDLRPSSDEDMLVLPEEYESCKNALTDAGMSPKSSRGDDSYQVSFFGDDGLHVELHKALFPTEIEYFREWNRIFEDAFSRAQYINIEGTSIRTLSPTDHLLYLILHALKHFLHSGVGIRQICDIVMFANAYGSETDWEYALSKLRKISAVQFAAAVFRIGETYLGFDKSKAHYPKVWQEISVDEKPLLEDVLSAGIYGSASLGRRHSSGITFSAAQGKKKSIAGRLFPSAKSMGSRYSYVKKYPVLLPVAWSQRLLSYSKETRKEDMNTPLMSLQIGKERLLLLSKYGLLPNESSE